MTVARVADILRLLCEERVEFIVVGMTAGVLQGAPLTTLDLDIVHRRDPENVERLLTVLESIDATYRHGSRGLRPKQSHLLGAGHQLLKTALGDLDCLGSIGDETPYEELLHDTIEMELAGGHRLLVISLAALIRSKEQAARPKDLAALPVLRATLDESRRRK